MALSISGHRVAGPASSGDAHVAMASHLCVGAGNGQLSNGLADLVVLTGAKQHLLCLGILIKAQHAVEHADVPLLGIVVQPLNEGEAIGGAQQVDEGKFIVTHGWPPASEAAPGGFC